MAVNYNWNPSSHFHLFTLGTTHSEISIKDVYKENDAIQRPRHEPSFMTVHCSTGLISTDRYSALSDRL